MQQNSSILLVLAIIGLSIITGSQINASPKIFICNKELPHYVFKKLPKMIESHRASFETTLLNDGKVLITGGVTKSNLPTNTAEIYDPTNNKFVKLPNMNFTRAEHSAILLNDGNVLIIGGISKNKGKTLFLKTAEIYNPKSKKFTIIGNSNLKGTNLQLYKTKDNKILVFKDNNNIGIFNQKTYKFQLITINKKYSLSGLGKGILVGDENIVFFQSSNKNNNKFGGECSFKIFNTSNYNMSDTGISFPYYNCAFIPEKINNNQILLINKLGNNSQLYDIRNNTLKDVGALKDIRTFSFGSILLDDGNVLIIDGSTLVSGTFLSKYKVLRAAEVFIPKDKAFIKIASPHFARANLKLVKLKNGNVLILGDNKHSELLVVNR